MQAVRIRFALCFRMCCLPGLPEPWDDGGGPDTFEIEIGNRIAYSAPLWEGGRAFADLRTRWLPYYGEPLREERLQMVNDACRLNIERVHFAVTRGLNFYGFDRLYLSCVSRIPSSAVHRAPRLSDRLQQVDTRAS
jgi:hypothetical protein